MTNHTDTPGPAKAPSGAVSIPGCWAIAGRNARSWWHDYIWPSLEPLSAEGANAKANRLKQRKDRDAARVDEQEPDLGRLASSLAECKSLFEAEQERRKSVDTRLTAVVALTSALAAVVTLAPSGLDSTGTGDAPLSHSLLLVLGLLSTVYAVLQLLCGLRAAVQGLQRKAYPVPEVVDVLKPAGVGDAAFTRSRMRMYVELLHEHEELNNEKLSQMAIAHRALRNFLWAALALVLLLISTRVVP